jgi:hypothetical protein
MIVAQIFAALVWTFVLLGTVALAWEDITEFTRWPGLTHTTLRLGIALRLLITAAVVAAIIGLPLMLMGWA